MVHYYFIHSKADKCFRWRCVLSSRCHYQAFKASSGGCALPGETPSHLCRSRRRLKWQRGRGSASRPVMAEPFTRIHPLPSSLPAPLIDLGVYKVEARIGFIHSHRLEFGASRTMSSIHGNMRMGDLNPFHTYHEGARQSNNMVTSGRWRAAVSCLNYLRFGFLSPHFPLLRYSPMATFFSSRGA